jgi:hypothetical protein
VPIIKRFQVWLSCRQLPDDFTPVKKDRPKDIEMACVCCARNKKLCEESVMEDDKRLAFRRITAEEDEELEGIIQQPNATTSLYHFADRFDVPLLRADIVR